jgi:predicted porin
MMMKKTLVALALFAAASAALATDVTASAGRIVGAEATVASVTLGQQLGPVRGTATVGRAWRDGANSNIVGVGATYPLVKLQGVTLAAKAGASYVNTSGPGNDGFALDAGVEASYPVTKTISLVASAERVQAQKRVGRTSGNEFAVGLRTSF